MKALNMSVDHVNIVIVLNVCKTIESVLNAKVIMV